MLETGPSFPSLKEVSCRQSPSRKLKRGLLELHEKSIQRIRIHPVLCSARSVRPLLSPLSGGRYHTAVARTPFPKLQQRILIRPPEIRLGLSSGEGSRSPQTRLPHQDTPSKSTNPSAVTPLSRKFPPPIIFSPAAKPNDASLPVSPRPPPRILSTDSVWDQDSTWNRSLFSVLLSAGFLFAAAPSCLRPSPLTAPYLATFVVPPTHIHHA